jgi:hypothetical protein
MELKESARMKLQLAVVGGTIVLCVGFVLFWKQKAMPDTSHVAMDRSGSDHTGLGDLAQAAEAPMSPHPMRAVAVENTTPDQADAPQATHAGDAVVAEVWTDIEALAARVASSHASLDDLLGIAVALTNALPHAQLVTAAPGAVPQYTLFDDPERGRITLTLLPAGMERGVSDSYQFNIRSVNTIGYSGPASDVEGSTLRVKFDFDREGAQCVSAITQAEIRQTKELGTLMEGADPVPMGGAFVAGKQGCYWQGLTIAARRVNEDFGWISGFTQRMDLPSSNLADERIELIRTALQNHGGMSAKK